MALAPPIWVESVTQKVCNPTQHNFLQVGTNDKTTKVVCTKCGEVRKV